ncbi:MAG: hypothetical protein RLZZ126_511 [Pseudomonadota bacterium]|jgi:Kdo2-lipid IVA lauroyltransferase/acyltransferase
MSHLGVLFMRLLALLPLTWVRALGRLLGGLLYRVARGRRRVVMVNLGLCFPEWSVERRVRIAKAHFACFAQAWLDRSWLWHAPESVLRRRLRLVGQLPPGQAATLFAPHFVGLDAGWTALTLHEKRSFSTIYSHQSNGVVDRWIMRGRSRFGQTRLFDRAAGPKPVVQGLRAGETLYLLPDMNYGLPESIFVPFFGVPAATVTSLSRLAKLGRAPVVPVLTTLTRQGYDIEVLPAWADVPSDNLEHDTALMNLRLQDWIGRDDQAHVAQYYWVHKRFKDRPPGDADVYV